MIKGDGLVELLGVKKDRLLIITIILCIEP